MKNLIKKIIVENQERISKLQVIDRKISLEPNANYILTGQRRIGKTYLLYHYIKQLLNKGTELKEILYLNFEDERLLEFTVQDFDKILESYQELYKGQPILFFDEIQNIEGWQNFARRLADTNYKIWVTGSNAQMLSSEMATTLGGRFLVKEMDTLSFEEYLLFQNITIEKQIAFSEKRFEVQRLFEDYFYYGGFPELFKFINKQEYLSNVFQKIFLGDIIARHQIRNPHALKLMIKKLAESTMDEVSFHRIKDIIQSTGIQVGTSTLIEYFKYIEDAFLIRSTTNYNSKIGERETKKKYYFRDHGLLNLFLTYPEAFCLETIVFNELRKRFPTKLYYLKDNFEVDFFVPEVMLLQVSYKMNETKTREREISSLLKASKLYNIEELIIITHSQEEIINLEGKKIKIIPVWKWLLNV